MKKSIIALSVIVSVVLLLWGITSYFQQSAKYAPSEQLVLYIIDGQQSLHPATYAQSLDPNKIESIQVLKDAEAQKIYGKDAANGVVLITTRAGEEK